MRLLGKILLGIVVLLVVAVGVWYWWFTSNYPKVGTAPVMKIEPTPELLARGEYLANHVCGCIDCHSTRDWRYYAGPIDESTKGKGGQIFDQAMIGIPGTIYASNITPAGIGSYTDGELYHTITTGVTKSGRAMFPMMPYPNFGTLDDSDVKAIIAYIRTLAPVENAVPESKLNFPMNLIVRLIPRPAAPSPIPDTADDIAYGKYMTSAAGCYDCHTQIDDKGKPLPGMDYAGGMEIHFPAPWSFLNRTANITPDNATGIGNWSREQFIAKFRSFAPDSVRQVALDSTTFNTAMPWTLYSGMTDKDLGSIYAYLRTIKPVNHKVEHFERETMSSH